MVTTSTHEGSKTSLPLRTPAHTSDCVDDTASAATATATTTATAAATAGVDTADGESEAWAAFFPELHHTVEGLRTRLWLLQQLRQGTTPDIVTVPSGTPAEAAGNQRHIHIVLATMADDLTASAARVRQLMAAMPAALLLAPDDLRRTGHSHRGERVGQGSRVDDPDDADEGDSLVARGSGDGAGLLARLLTAGREQPTLYPSGHHDPDAIAADDHCSDVDESEDEDDFDRPLATARGREGASTTLTQTLAMFGELHSVLRHRPSMSSRTVGEP
jgi:hypothetical protein